MLVLFLHMWPIMFFLAVHLENQMTPSFKLLHFLPLDKPDKHILDFWGQQQG